MSTSVDGQLMRGRRIHGGPRPASELRTASCDPHRQTRFARQAHKATANTRRDLDPPGASQAIESCKRQSSSAGAGSLTAGIGQTQQRDSRTPARLLSAAGGNTELA